MFEMAQIGALDVALLAAGVLALAVRPIRETPYQSAKDRKPDGKPQFFGGSGV